MKKQKMVLVGLGLTDSHGHKRITRGDDFVLTGGNEETHAGMQERAIKFSERLKKKGKTLEELQPEEVRDMLE